MTRRGRPSVLTDEVLARVAELRAAGLGYTRIAHALGIGRTTVARVLRNPAFLAQSQNQDVEAGREEI